MENPPFYSWVNQLIYIYIYIYIYFYGHFQQLFVCLPEGNYMGFKMIVDNEYGESLGEKWGWAKLPMK